MPYEETIGAIAELIKEGKVRYLGVSEVGVDDLRRAHVPYRVLADGLLSGAVTGEPTSGNTQMVAPRLQGENVKHNVEVFSFLKKMAAEKGYTPAQLSIAWLLTRGDDIIPQIGMSDPSRLAENLTILDISFSDEELVKLDQVFAPGAIVGERYPAFVMKYAAQ